MSQFFQIHPDNPQARLIKQAADILRDGGLAVIPTDCAYALACRLGDKKATERVQRLRQLDNRHNFTLLCRDLSELSTFAKVANTEYRAHKLHKGGRLQRPGHWQNPLSQGAPPGRHNCTGKC